MIKEAGCILDGAFGDETNDKRLIELAKSAGMSGDIDPDSALEYLNTHCVSPELILVWLDGDLVAVNKKECKRTRD